MTYEDFLARVDALWGNNIIQISQRYGQLYFNVLHELRPDIANKIRATELDPFYFDDVKLETIQAVIENW